MRQWVKKLVDQFDLEWGGASSKQEVIQQLSEDRATLLYVIDVFNKHLIETDTHPVRRTRETLDEYTKALMNPDPLVAEKAMFRFRQFFSGYRIDEYTYMQKTFEDFKGIIWDFADQLADDVQFEKAQDQEIRSSLHELREAVEANSIDVLRTKSREFIDFYVEHQTRNDERKTKRMEAVQQNLSHIKKQLMDANQTMRTDHLSGAFNRKSFDEQIKKYCTMSAMSKSPVTLLMLDIDHFKKINDSYGHHVGDFVIKECVRLLKEVFHRDNDFVARIGGEEFAVLLPDFKTEHAIKKAEEALQHIRKDALVHSNMQIRFTVSMGLAELNAGEAAEKWIERADKALYSSKHNGRNRVTISGQEPAVKAS